MILLQFLVSNMPHHPQHPIGAASLCVAIYPIGATQCSSPGTGRLQPHAAPSCEHWDRGRGAGSKFYSPQKQMLLIEPLSCVPSCGMEALPGFQNGCQVAGFEDSGGGRGGGGRAWRWRSACRAGNSHPVGQNPSYPDLSHGWAGTGQRRGVGAQREAAALHVLCPAKRAAQRGGIALFQGNPCGSSAEPSGRSPAGSVPPSKARLPAPHRGCPAGTQRPAARSAARLRPAAAPSWARSAPAQRHRRVGGCGGSPGLVFLPSSFQTTLRLWVSGAVLRDPLQADGCPVGGAEPPPAPTPPPPHHCEYGSCCEQYKLRQLASCNGNAVSCTPLKYQK